VKSENLEELNVEIEILMCAIDDYREQLKTYFGEKGDHTKATLRKTEGRLFYLVECAEKTLSLFGEVCDEEYPAEDKPDFAEVTR